MQFFGSLVLFYSSLEMKLENETINIWKGNYSNFIKVNE